MIKMKDIASLAGVSKSAVSIALSGKPGISDETRNKILQIVKDTGYVPRSLVKADQLYNPPNAIRFVASTNSGIVQEQYMKQPFFTELLHNLEEQCRTHGYSLLFSAVDMQHFDRDIHQFVKDDSAAGVILLGTNLSREQIRKAAQNQPRMVVLDTCYETLDVNFIVINNSLGAYTAGRYLAELGHKHIGYVQSSLRMYNFDKRKQGFMEALTELGLPMKEADLFHASPMMLAQQHELREQLSSRIKQGKPIPTALFCECDYIAISVIKTITELGLRVPQDVSVVGFDNISESAVITPELTTIHVDKEEIASLAVNKIIELQNTVKAATKTFVDTRFVERKSAKTVQAK